MLNNYSVIAGNLGLIYSGNNGFTARVEYNRAVGQSKRNEGRIAGEPVWLLKNDDIVKEYAPASN